MHPRLDRETVESLLSEETESVRFDIDTVDTDREFVLRSIAELAESDLGVLHQPPSEVQRLYLIAGGVFRLGYSGVTRLS